MIKRRRRKSSSPKLEGLNESQLEQRFYNLVLSHHFPKVTQQHKFHPSRNWRFDFCWPERKLAVEIQGIGPGHLSVKGMLSDYEKHNAATLLGWRLLYFMNVDLDPYHAEGTIAIVRKALS